jgi:cytochrome P450
MPTWEPLSDAVLADQLGTFDRMRFACTAAASPRGVTLFRHGDVAAAANDPVRFSSVTTPHPQRRSGADGGHACPGRPLATMELVVTSQSLVSATTGIRPAPDAAPVRETDPVCGWRHVPVRLQ